jgi:hypothetical protein
MPNQAFPIFGAASQKGLSGTGLDSVLTGEKMGSHLYTALPRPLFLPVYGVISFHSKAYQAILKNFSLDNVPKSIQEPFQIRDHPMSWNIFNQQRELGSCSPFLGLQRLTIHHLISGRPISSCILIYPIAHQGYHRTTVPSEADQVRL